MSPFGARGGNSGIQDADNLIWKLHWVMRGWARETLLQTYDSERREGAEHNVLVTNRTARFLSPRSPAERMIRNAAIDLARKYPFGRTFVNTGRMSVASTYTRSDLAEAVLRQGLSVDAPGAGRPLQNVALREHGDLVSLLRSLDGRLLLIASDPATARRVDLTELAGPGLPGCYVDAVDGFAVAGAGGAPQGWQLVAAAEGAGVALARALDLIPGRVLLIRPDLHSGGCVAPEALGALLACYRSAVGPSADATAPAAGVPAATGELA